MEIRKVMRIATISVMILGWLAILGMWLYLVFDTHQIASNGVIIEVMNPYIDTMTIIITAMFAGGIGYLWKTSQHRKGNLPYEEVKV